MLTRAGLVIVIFKCIDTYCKIKKKNLLIWFLISVDKMSAGLSYVDVIFEGLSTFWEREAVLTQKVWEPQMCQIAPASAPRDEYLLITSNVQSSVVTRAWEQL
jgi:hypothetical protein